MSANEATPNPSHIEWTVNNYGSKYDIQCRALAYTDQQAIKKP